MVLRPAQSRPTRPARTWLACSGHSSWRRPPRGWRSAAHTASSTQVACLASGGALLGAKTHPVTPRMLGARVVGVLGRPAELGPRGGIQRTVRIHPVLWVPRPSGVLGWLSCVRRASRSGARGAGRRDSHFGGRHRTSCYRVRCWRGGAPFWASRRGTRHPDIGSRPFGAVFIWIRGRSCIDRSSSRGPLHARPAALCPPQSEERSDQIRGTGATRGPRRRKVPVMGSQAHGGHPAAASRPGTLTYYLRSVEDVKSRFLQNG